MRRHIHASSSQDTGHSAPRCWTGTPRPMAPDGHFDEPRGGAAPGHPSTQFSLRRQVMRDAGITPFAATGTGAPESPVTPRPVTYADLHRRLRQVKQWPERFG
jgi:hypothetical protein